MRGKRGRMGKGEASGLRVRAMESRGREGE